MSARQVKKIINKAQNTPVVVNSESSSEDEKNPKFRFNAVDFSDNESDTDPASPTPEPQVKTKISKAESQKPAVQSDDISDLIQHSEQEEQKLSSVESCLKRETKYFDSENELQKLFKEKKKVKSRSTKKAFILTPSLSKPPNIKINYLPLMERKGQGFCFEGSKGYLKLHGDYLFCVESNNPGLLHEFSFKYPFHIEALYQLALFFKLQAKYEQVHQILEKILFSYQLAFHHQFSPIGKDVQISSETLLNRIFFKSVFMFIDCLGRKGCYRTALEFCKFLLSLDYGDPLGVLFLIDFYSLSTKNFEYFVFFSANFMKEFLNKNRTLTLPSSLYSLALAKAMMTNSFNISQKDSDRAFELRKLDSLHEESPGVILLCAVSSFPIICKLLLSKLAPSYQFLYEEGVDSWDYQQVGEIFVNRNLELWRNEQIVSWVKQAADEAEIVGKKDFEDIWVYENLETEDFSFSSRTLIPQDLAFK